MNGVASCRLITSCLCAVRRWVVGPFDTVAIHRERAAGRHYTVATYCEWPADWRCPIAVLQTPCSHVLSAFNVPLAACLVCAWYWPYRMAP
jgi:hypothetical protein